MLELQGLEYQLQGLELLSLAKKYHPPFYLYDGQIIENRYQRLIQAFHRLPVQIRYACKVLSNINILHLLCRLGAGLDTVSAWEIELALIAGFSPQKIIFTPSCISFSEMEKAIDRNVMINIDSLALLEEFGKHYSEVPCCLRWNPDIVAGGNKLVQTGHISSKFGIAVSKIEEVLSLVRKYGIQVTGIHTHTGSDISDPNVFLETADIMFRLACHFPTLQFLDFGGGFKVPYHPEGKNMDLQKLAEALEYKYREFCREFGKEPEIWFEPGKYLVAEAGFLLASVNIVKKAGDIILAGVGTGMNHFIRPALYDAYHHVTNISNPGAKTKKYTITGYICEADILAENREISEIRTGDILCFHNAGAYCFTMSSQYNSRPRPPEILIYQGKDLLIRRRETLNDLLQCQYQISPGNFS